MRNSLVRPAGRRGFTLIELMMVIAIIGVLVAILAVALGPIMNKGPEMVTRNDINQLGIALENFKNDFGFYPPSQMILCANCTAYSTSDLRANDSKAYMLKMFPRIATLWSTNGVKWNPSSLPGDSPILSGDQCLVFFLGGIQTKDPTTGVLQCNGFPRDPNDFAKPPSQWTSTPYGPYFEFKSDRLTDQISTRTGSTGFFSYMDGYKQKAPNGLPSVYAYFSSGKRRNGYNMYFPMGFTRGDCSSLTNVFDSAGNSPPLGPFPYEQSPNNFHNPNSFQIISAGKDGVFGAGSPVFNNATPPAAVFNLGGDLWTPDTAATWAASAKNKNPTGLGDGRDDITNFNATVLGKQ